MHNEKDFLLVYFLYLMTIYCFIAILWEDATSTRHLAHNSLLNVLLGDSPSIVPADSPHTDRMYGLGVQCVQALWVDEFEGPIV